MSRHGAVELDWADGTYTFRLAIDQIEELEEKASTAAGRDVSLFAISAALSPTLRNPRLVYIREVLRLGLIGGGMKPVDALAKVRRYVDERPLDESRDIAYSVALAALARVHPGDLGLEEGEAPAAEQNGSTSPLSEQGPH